MIKQDDTVGESGATEHRIAIVFARSSGFGAPELEDRNLEPLDRAKKIAIRYLVALHVSQLCHTRF
eukprot:3043711-Pyramimonas_sp.AAC.1